MYIHADYDQLYSNAASLVNDSNNYASLVMRIRTAMESTQENWQGSDAAAFLSKAQSLQPQLLKMQDIIQDYANVLRQTAQTYETLQSQRQAMTAALL